MKKEFNAIALLESKHICQWYTSANFLYGTPVNADAIAPALNDILLKLIHEDPTPAQFDMTFSKTIAYYELFQNYMEGKYNAPAPVFHVAMACLDNIDLEIGETATGKTIPYDIIHNVQRLDNVIQLCNDYSTEPGLYIAQFELTFTNVRRLSTYSIKRIDNYNK